MGHFHKDIFRSLVSGEKQQRAQELAARLSQRLAVANDFDAEVARIIDSLREQGHDIWSWDYDDGRQIWGPNYQQPQMTGLIIEFDAPSAVAARWVEDADSDDVRAVFGDGLNEPQ